MRIKSFFGSAGQDRFLSRKRNQNKTIKPSEGVFTLKYDFAAIEPKWQKRWEEAKVYAAGDRSETQFRG